LKTLAIVQARMGSTRFPKKVMKLINGKPMIELLLARLSLSKKIDKIILGTSQDTINKPLIEHVERIGYSYYQGREMNVLERFYEAAKIYNPEIVIRITGDCPLVDYKVVDEVLEMYEKSDFDYVCNALPPTFPDGLDVEVFSFNSLKEAYNNAVTDYEKEHVTVYIQESEKYRRGNLFHSKDYSAERWTVDEPEDFTVIENVFNYFHPRIDFSWLEVINLLENQPKLFHANRHLTRNEGVIMGTGQKLWKRAKKIIPGGNMLLSKRSEMFLPDQWPSYFSKSKGCKVWDLDGKEFIDMSIMGVGTNTLGYGHPEVDEAVKGTIESGNMSTLNCPEEVYLAEKLIELHPWADMVRFARSGGEANAIAIRIARAASGKDKVAFCGYHGWHDWYLAANLGDEKNLAGHLIPGLEPNGVPRNLKNTVFPFKYNDFFELENLVNNEDIGVIKMEVSRNQGPQDGYLEKIRKLATDKGIVLIFDECTSGFRQTLGGLHKFYGVEPDMAMFGKALGNGYAITSTIGRREIMQAAQSTFISSTFWTERIGPSAGLKTLEVMEKIKSYDTITEVGKNITQGWLDLAKKYELKIETSGLPALTSFGFISSENLAYTSFITQEMLAKGFLASTSVYVCIAHTKEIVDHYFAELEPIFSIIKECEEGSRNIYDLLKGPVCHERFKRLN
jgi:glutamate-1-semialdehyde 2,1-aminomutase